MKNHNRQSQLGRVAYELGLQYQAEDDWGLVNQLQDFRLFRRGIRKRMRHMMLQQDGLMRSEIRIFDYRFVIPAGNHSRRVQQTVFFLKSQALDLPQFWMRPEHFFHKVGELLGLGDIDFEEHPEFSSNYRLTGEDEAYIRHRFNDNLLHFFQVERGWTVEGIGYYLLLYKKNKLLAPNQIIDLYRTGKKLAQLFPEKPIV